MTLIRPRLTDYFGIDIVQEECDFAIPFLDEDIPLYVDPFLLWRSPSLQDKTLHTGVTNSFNHLNSLVHKNRIANAREILIACSECAEVGLGHSKKRKGNRISSSLADTVLSLFRDIDHYRENGFSHFEEIQLYIDGISSDRVSDLCCNFLKSFLVDYTIECCEESRIPMESTTLGVMYDYSSNSVKTNVSVTLPVNPETKEPIILVPKRWLRFGPWIAFDDYFKNHCPRDEIFNPNEPIERVKVLRYNRDHYGLVRQYVEAKERQKDDCRHDPLFSQLPVSSAKRKFSEIIKLPSGKSDNADKKYEDLQVQLLASLMYPHLDFATAQSRVDSGVAIRDLIFYNNRRTDFLEEILDDYGSRQLIFELKNVKAIEREHINQLNRYLNDSIGGFGILVTRNPLPKAMFKNTVDLWSGQRRCILSLTDADIELMVNVFESRQRTPIEVLKRAYIEFRRACPT